MICSCVVFFELPLANRLVDWNIDVKTEEQFAEMEHSPELKEVVEKLFNQADEVQNIRELSDIPLRIADIFASHGIERIEDLISLTEESRSKISELTSADWDLVNKVLTESVDIVEDEEVDSRSFEKETENNQEEIEEIEIYECPECGHEITVDMTVCPNCGVGLSFEYEEEE